MKKFYLFLFILVAGILVGTVFFFYIWNRPKQDISNALPDYTLSVHDFIGQFAADTATAKAKYNQKIVALNGKLGWKENDRENNTHLFFQENDITVQCTLSPQDSKRAMSLKPKQAVQVKGSYTGTDSLLGLTIKLNNCVLMAK